MVILNGTTTYGYDYNGSAANQLLDVLKLDAGSAEAKTARNNLNALRKEYLNLEETASVQKKAREELQSELLKRYPELYGGTDSAKKLYYAGKYAINRHTQHRAHITHRKKSRKDAIIQNGRQSNLTSAFRCQKQRAMTTPTLSSSSGGSQENSSPVRNAAHNILPKPIHIPVPIPTRRSTDHPKFRPAYKTPVGAHPRTQVFITRGLGLSTACCSVTPCQPASSTPLPSIPIQPSMPSPCTPTPFSSLVSTSGGKGLTTVRSFLISCSPSMEKYLHRFIDFGCKTEEYLSCLAAWDSERRIKVLKKILSETDGTLAVNEMDLEILQAQLETYFA